MAAIAITVLTVLATRKTLAVEFQAPAVLAVAILLASGDPLEVHLRATESRGHIDTRGGQNRGNCGGSETFNYRNLNKFI